MHTTFILGYSDFAILILILINILYLIFIVDLISYYNFLSYLFKFFYLNFNYANAVLKRLFSD